MSAPHRGTCRAESDAAAATARLRFAAARARRMSLDSFFSVLAVPEGRFDRTRKVDRRQQVNSPSNSDGMILRTDGRLSKRSEEHTSELQSLMRTSYAVLCVKKKTI